MYYPYFLAYMLMGFAVSLGVFFWALNKGQFQDQQRARFLPLEDRPDAGPAGLSRSGRWQAAILLVLACSGLAATGIAIVLSLLRAG